MEYRYYLFLTILLSDIFPTAQSFSFFNPKYMTSYASSISNELTYDKNSWKAGFTSCEKEICEKLEGFVPADIKGTYFRNGYGKFMVGKEPVMHPFDADGLVCAITLSDGKAVFRNRFVRTKGYQREKRARKILYRGAFGTQKSGGLLFNMFDVNIKNVANTNIIYWGGKLLALWEAGLPHRLEPESLRTIGEYTFRGLLPRDGTFSAHPRVDAATGRLINFSAAQGVKSCKLRLLEFDSNFDVKSERTFEVPGFVFFHDFIVTENYYIFNQAPTSFDPLPFVLGSKGPAACISFDDTKPAILYLIPRDSSKPVEKVEVDPHFNFHFANAYEEDGNIIFDVVKCSKMLLGDTTKSNRPIWEDLDYAKEVPYSVLTRYTLSKNNGNSWKYQSSDLSKTQVDFTSVSPSVSCKKHRYVYASCGSSLTESSPVQGLIKIDAISKTEQKWFGEKYEYLGEAIFIPRESSSGEDDGYVFSLLFNGKDKKSEFVIFDAKDISKGPISRLPISTIVPFGLHGSFSRDLIFNEDDITRKWKAAASIDNKNWNEVKSDFSGLGISY